MNKVSRSSSSRLLRLFRVVFVLLPLSLLGMSPSASRLDADAALDARPDEGITFERPPLRFELNEGQGDSQIQFTARDRDGISFLTLDGAVFQVNKARETQGTEKGDPKTLTDPDAGRFEYSFVRLKTVGSNRKPRVTGLDQLPGVTNYFLGDASTWRTNVAGYAKVKYEEVYPGIDLVYYGNAEGALEYDFIVAPGADPDQIALSIEGAEHAELDRSGNLIIRTITGEIHHPAPHIYQDIDGKRHDVSGRYKMSGNGRQLTFALGQYDATRPLVIDPQIIYATYLGGTSVSTIGNEGARTVTTDAQGAVYVAGDALSANFPTKSPLQGALFGFINVFITKLDANGQMVYSTFLGGNGYDGPAAIKVDETGAVYVGGSTSSSDFPTKTPIQGRGNRSDAFITKLNPAGSQIVYSTYLGKEDNEGIADLVIDSGKNVLVVGNIQPGLGVSANDFPTVVPIQATYGGGARDGFVAAISSVGTSLLFSSYLGGNGDDWVQSIGFNSNRSEGAIAFFTDSSNFPTVNLSIRGQKGGAEHNLDTADGPVSKGIHHFEFGAEDHKFEVIGTTAFAPLIGVFDPSTDKLVNIYMLAGGEVVPYSLVAGSSSSSSSSGGSSRGLQTQSAGGLDAIFQLFDRNFKAIKTGFYGGSGEDTLSAVTMDPLGGAYIIGSTRSTNLPTVSPVQATHSGGNAFDGFLAAFDPQNLDTVFATYLGGTGMEFLTDVTVDAQGNIYVVGETFGNFPNPTSGAIQSQLRGRTDAFIIKISPAIAQTPPPSPGPSGISPFNITNRGGVSLRTEGTLPSTSVGYGRIQPGAGNSTPSGMAIFGFRPGGVLVTEAAVPASGLIQSGRIYAEVNGPVNTGLAIANPNSQDATITFNFTDAAGQPFGAGTTIIPANSQIAKFLDQAPFNGGSTVSGTFTFSSNVPVSAVALRGFTNERAEFLITTLPVLDLSLPVPTAQTILFPHFAEGGGWTTQVVLINPTDTALSGNMQFFTPAGAAATLTMDGQAGTTFPYSIAPRSSRRMQSAGIGATQVGSIRVTPTAGNPTPAGVEIFTFKAAGVTVSEAGVPALRAANALRLYAEASGNFDASQIGSIETGIAIANSSASAATVTFELTRLDGTSTGMTGSVNVPGNGQTALFMNQIAGFSSLGNPSAPFQGVLRISSTSSAIAVVGLRGRYNERRDFLITTTAPVDEASAPVATELFFPHLADSGGYTTQFILFSGSAGQAAAGNLRLFSQTGQPFNLSLR